MSRYEGMKLTKERNAIILDIGTAYTKCGFGGEYGPRCIIPSTILRPRTGQVVKVWKYNSADELYDVLVDFIHMLYFRHLLVNPKERRAVVVESLLCPSIFRETLAKVLFNHFEVPSVLFAPSHLMAMFTLGISAGLVLDAGYEETIVLPVYESVPILKAWEALPLAGRAIHNYLEAQLKETGTISSSQTDKQSVPSVLDELDEATLEDIKVRCCFVTRLDRAKIIQEVKLHGESEEKKFPDPPQDAEYPLDGNKVLHISGRIREHTCEVLFEQDNEETSVATLILDSILKCPIDMRQCLASNIVVMGGTAMLPGFQHRLLAEVQELATSRPKYRDHLAVKTFKVHKPPTKENYTAWLGGAIMGALEVLGNRSISKESYTQNPTIPDWSSLHNVDLSDEKPLIKKTTTTTSTTSTTT